MPKWTPWFWIRAQIRPLLVVALCLLGVISLAYCATITSSYRQCSNFREVISSQKKNASFFEKSGTLFVCEGVTIETNSGFLSTVATFFVALFTGTLWIVTNNSVRLARDEFSATHRPELVIREVFWTTLADDGADVVAFTLINRGQSRCRIVESGIECRSDNPIVQFKTDGINSLGDISLAPGEFRFLSIKVDPFMAGTREILEEAFLRGMIIYEDNALIRRRLVFCRRAGKGNDRFIPLGDPEYEYTD